MIFDSGFNKKYRTLRGHEPEVYFLEDFYYKVLQLNVNSDGSFKFKDTLLGEFDNKITINFPEFLDTSKNLNLIKSVHLGFDLSLNSPKTFKDDSSTSVPNLIKTGKSINSSLDVVSILTENKTFKSFPDGMLKTFLGYRFTAIKDVVKPLENSETLICKQLSELDDSCYVWIQVSESQGISETTSKPSVCKFKVELDLDLFKSWLLSCVTSEEFSNILSELDLDSLDFNFILHPPYIGRMTFKDNIKILYPLKTSRIKFIDKVVFRSNRSYTINNKFYSVGFIDKQTEEFLFEYNTVKDADCFTNLKQVVDTTKVNSNLNSILNTFDSSAVVTFNVPEKVQIDLEKHKNYKIRIEAKDTTTKNRG